MDIKSKVVSPNITLGILVIVVINLIKIYGATPATDKCVTCHQGMSKEDIHLQKGISCSDCHGGDKTSKKDSIAMSKKNGFIGVPTGDKISEVCARCHSNQKIMISYGSKLPTNQFENLVHSAHGKANKYLERAAQCNSCHNAHDIMPVKDSLSPVYSLNIQKTCSKCHSDSIFMNPFSPTHSVGEFSKHISRLNRKLNSKGNGNPVLCVNCHGSHAIKAVKDMK